MTPEGRAISVFPTRTKRALLVAILLLLTVGSIVSAFRTPIPRENLSSYVGRVKLSTPRADSKESEPTRVWLVSTGRELELAVPATVLPRMGDGEEIIVWAEPTSQDRLNVVELRLSDGTIAVSYDAYVHEIDANRPFWIVAALVFLGVAIYFASMKLGSWADKSPMV